MNDVKTGMVIEIYRSHMKHVELELERLIKYLAELLDVPVIEVVKIMDGVDINQ
jgi:hypothetical protein